MQGAVQNSAGYSAQQRFQKSSRTKNSDVQLVSSRSPEADADFNSSGADFATSLSLSFSEICIYAYDHLSLSLKLARDLQTI